jgi:hypothetical protein
MASRVQQTVIALPRVSLCLGTHPLALNDEAQVVGTRVSSVLRVRVGCVGVWRKMRRYGRETCASGVCLSVCLSVCVSERIRAPFDLGVHACVCLGVGMCHGAEG